MRRFRLEVVSPEHFPDQEGVVLHNLEDAEREALRLGAALVRDYPEAFAKAGPWRMVVLDEAGNLLAELELGPQTRSAFRLAQTLGPPLEAGKRLGPRPLGGGQLYLRKRTGKKDR